jgi:hypothetical protein
MNLPENVTSTIAENWGNQAARQIKDKQLDRYAWTVLKALFVERKWGGDLGRANQKIKDCDAFIKRWQKELGGEDLPAPTTADLLAHATDELTTNETQRRVFEVEADVLKMSKHLAAEYEAAKKALERVGWYIQHWTKEVQRLEGLIAQEEAATESVGESG